MKGPVFCVGGLDPSGGAGLAADLKTLSALGVHGCAITTAITAQNSQSFTASYPVTPTQFRTQWESLLEESTPAVIKIGLIPQRELLCEVFSLVACCSGAFVIFDPVLATSSGFDFGINPQELTHFLKYVDLFTPNFTEAERIFPGKDPIAESLRWGAKSVLLKGGHGSDPEFATDVWGAGEGLLHLSGPRQPGTVRGTGCSFAAAIAGFYVKSASLREALVQAKSYVQQSWDQSSIYLQYKAWPQDQVSLPQLNRQEVQFPACGILGLYPIVDRSYWLERLLPLGVQTIQLRIKDLKGEQLEEEIVRSIQLARQYNCKLFINDYWLLALRHQAYGVHLGQEDLDEADLAALNGAHLRLGISTHSLEEAARAHGLSPSYVALGPIFETTAKKMKFAPQGLDRIGLWKRLMPYPLVAIGGLSPQRGRECLRAGADALAVMSDITQAADPIERVKEWLDIATLSAPHPAS